MAKLTGPITCQWCNQNTGFTEEQVTEMVDGERFPYNGLKCGACKEVFMRYDRMEWILAGD